MRTCHALQEAKALKDGALQRGGSFAAVLADYVRTGGNLPGATAQNMANEAERLLRAADRCPTEFCAYYDIAAVLVWLWSAHHMPCVLSILEQDRLSPGLSQM